MIESFRPTPWYDACTIAFSSPWLQRHSSSFVPASVKLLQRGQPPSLQFLTPLGVPLYPVETILLSFTITAATFLFTQLLRVATSLAIFMKYSSQSGRSKFCGSVCRALSIFLFNSGIGPLLSIFLSAILITSSICCAFLSALFNSLSSSFLNSCTVFGSPGLALLCVLLNLISSLASM